VHPRLSPVIFGEKKANCPFLPLARSWCDFGRFLDLRYREGLFNSSFLPIIYDKYLIIGKLFGKAFVL